MAVVGLAVAGLLEAEQQGGELPVVGALVGARTAAGLATAVEGWETASPRVATPLERQGRVGARAEVGEARAAVGEAQEMVTGWAGEAVVMAKPKALAAAVVARTKAKAGAAKRQ